MMIHICVTAVWVSTLVSLAVISLLFSGHSALMYSFIWALYICSEFQYLTGSTYLTNFPMCRWYHNPQLDVTTVPSVTLNSVTADHPLLTGTILANPLNQPVEPTGKIAPLPTQTISAQEVFHHSQAALKAVTCGIKMQEDLQGLLDDMAKIECVVILKSWPA
ncbi:hypothetical protein FRB95_011055 [Tulasnella sp. JGI-2019a]|nr:hypothetical protein FRB95_011055 [Tulasnella sp. JGI-2019a]